MLRIRNLLFAVFLLLTRPAVAEDHNLKAMQQIQSPKWVLRFFKSIDTLDTSEDSGFSYFADDVQMQFGKKVVKGISKVKQFFQKIDSPLETSHRVISTWRTGNIIFLQGLVNLRRKEASPDQTKTFTFFNFFWLNRRKQVAYYVVVIPPALQKFLMR